MVEIKQVSPKDLAAGLADNNILLVDVRDEKDYQSESIPGAINIPMAKLVEELTVDKVSDKQLVLQCQSGKRSLMACDELKKQDRFETIGNLEGGILAWKSENRPTNQQS